jgi:uncharacterized membrane protein YesL
MQVSGLMGSLYTITDWIMRLSIINILWISINLPILFILFLMVLSPSHHVVVMLAIPLVVLLPLLFFPGTTAAFAMIRDWIFNKSHPPLLKGFWEHFKKNYKNSTLSGILLTWFWFVWVIDYYYLRSLYDVLGIMLILIGLLLFTYTIIYFCLSVHYYMSKKELFKNAFYVTFGSPLLLIGILLVNIFILFISTRFLFLLPFFSISLSIFLSFYAFYRFTLKVGKTS